MMEDGKMKNDAVKVMPLCDDADRDELHHYTASGLVNYWLSPGLYEVAKHDEEDVIIYKQLDDVQAAIGMHICTLMRPLGPREIKFLRSELGFSQSEMGCALGYRDKQPVLKAERLNEKREPLSATADLLLRNVYLGMIGEHPLVGEAYRAEALRLSNSLLQMPRAVEAEIDYQIAA
jgi:DNA-binding transcriptional regulator YiaG